MLLEILRSIERKLSRGKGTICHGELEEPLKQKLLYSPVRFYGHEVAKLRFLRGEQMNGNASVRIPSERSRGRSATHYGGLAAEKGQVYCRQLLATVLARAMENSLRDTHSNGFFPGAILH